MYGSGKIVIHQRPGKLGLGTAYIDGLQRARAPFVVLMDADLSHHPKFIPEMYRCGWGRGVEEVAGRLVRVHASRHLEFVSPD